MKISIIVAVDQQNGIGKNNTLPWRLPADLKYFKEITMGHHMLMGRKTFESIGKALPGRTSIVVTRQESLNFPKEVMRVNSVEKGIQAAKQAGEEELFIIGGGELYKQSIELANVIYLTRVDTVANADTFFPIINKRKWTQVEEEDYKADEKNQFGYTFSTWVRQH